MYINNEKGGVEMFVYKGLEIWDSYEDVSRDEILEDMWNCVEYSDEELCEMDDFELMEAYIDFQIDEIRLLR